MKVLITNHALDRRAGTELYVRDLALGLLKTGHAPICFSPVLGEVAREISAAGIDVRDDLSDLDAPDIIHAHHHPSAALALSAFPRTPALYACHGVKPWQEAPLAQFPNIRRFVAVDEPCRQFLVNEHGIPASQVELILNGVDLVRFAHDQPARDEPARRTRALLISNIARPEDAEPFRKACRQNGFELDIAGANTRVMDRPETGFPKYGLVFAKARAALEAMASGCAVILADYGYTGARVTGAGFDDLRTANFGFSVIDQRPDAARLAEAIAGIDWDDAAGVTRKVRATAGFAGLVETYVALYRDLMSGGPVEQSDPADAMRAYLAAIMPQLAERDELAGKFYHEVSARLVRDRSLASLIAAVSQDPARWPDLLRAAQRLDPANPDILAKLSKRP